MKFVIGTHIMFYEVHMFGDFVESVLKAIEGNQGQDEIIVDFCLNASEFFEKIDTEVATREDIYKIFYDTVNPIKETSAKLNTFIYLNDDKPYTMTDYRRELNDKYCNQVDMVIWGESDCLVPLRAFEILRHVNEYANNQNIYRYITTFATRKMWDHSWTVLEHPEFTNLPYYEKDHPDCFTSPHSIRYNMTLEEMKSVNSKVNSGTIPPDVRMITYPKFDGSLLCISSDLIKAGCNIPPGIFGLSGEDTSFMVSCMKIMGENYRQFVIKNVLKVHNREHSRKRIGAKTMNSEDKSTQENKGNWYNKIRKLNKQNLDIYMNNPQGKFLSWDDINV